MCETRLKCVCGAVRKCSPLHSRSVLIPPNKTLCIATGDTGLQQRIITKPNPPCNKKINKRISRLIFMEMSIDAPFRWWHQRVECHIFCRWDWAAARGLVANTIEECKHTGGRKRPINAASLGLINYLKKETEVWGRQRNLIRTRFITQSVYHHSPLTDFTFLCPSPSTDSSVSCEWP